MADRLTGIEVLVRAVRLGSLSAAARATGMSSTMAARHLEMLEARLSTTLVRRTTRKLSLTEAGAAFLDRAERLLADLGEAEAEATAGTAAVKGLVRVSAPAVLGTMHLAPLLPMFAAAYPAVSIELGLNDRTVDLLEERWDMAIRIGRLADSTLVARKIADVRLSLCAAPDYLRRRGTPQTISDLGRHDCLGYTLSDRMTAQLWSFGRDGAVRVPVRGTLAADNGHALMTAAIGGQGLLYGPHFIVAAAIADGRLAELTLDQPVMDLGAIYALTHPTRRPSAKVRAWIEFITAKLREMARDW
ncbi:LysR family transcriptional regulator [Methylobacterium variabile]|jgi:DNA-binding transcriptional LysR family regulator|uniref:LysR family transcriptional regulator n=1 Tax=Methylobacterium variabile TaxID=298794 RepID=A0A0J6S459_9HYPH|nr:LysR family transcriptional regulator [Methylobacterium variabile]KMO29980.1 LysR family transcriptional regulator [Methylobacterium variabile]